MQLMDVIKETEFLSREFLVWIWYKSETNGGMHKLTDDREVELWVDRKIVLRYDDENGSEKITCTGDNPHLKEAKFGLFENKQVTESKLKLLIDDNEYSFTLDASWMNLKSFKTPKVMQDKDDDPEGIFYEKIYLIDQALSTLDTIYGQFVNLRLSQEWKDSELPAIIDWIRQVRKKH